MAIKLFASFQALSWSTSMEKCSPSACQKKPSLSSRAIAITNTGLCPLRFARFLPPADFASLTTNCLPTCSGNPWSMDTRLCLSSPKCVQSGKHLRRACALCFSQRLMPNCLQDVLCQRLGSRISSTRCHLYAMLDRDPLGRASPVAGQGADPDGFTCQPHHISIMNLPWPLLLTTVLPRWLSQ